VAIGNQQRIRLKGTEEESIKNPHARMWVKYSMLLAETQIKKL